MGNFPGEISLFYFSQSIDGLEEVALCHLCAGVVKHWTSFLKPQVEDKMALECQEFTIWSSKL